MNAPVWFSNLLFWSAQAALLVLIGGLLRRVLQIQQPRIVLVYWRVLLGISLGLPFIQPWHRPSLQLVAEIFGIVVLAGIAARFVILALGLLKLRQLRHHSSSVSPYPETAALLEQVGAQVKVDADFRLSRDVDSPITFGFTVPVILLPQGFGLMNSEFQAAIACHELILVVRAKPSVRVPQTTVHQHPAAQAHSQGVFQREWRRQPR